MASGQISAAKTIETLAIVLAEHVKEGMDIDVARAITKSLCNRIYTTHGNRLKTFESAWARFQGRIRKP